MPTNQCCSSLLNSEGTEGSSALDFAFPGNVADCAEVRCVDFAISDRTWFTPTAKFKFWLSFNENVRTPSSSPLSFTRGPPLFPGLAAAFVCTYVVESLSIRTADTIPVVSEYSYPSGAPMIATGTPGFAPTVDPRTR